MKSKKDTNLIAKEKEVLKLNINKTSVIKNSSDFTNILVVDDEPATQSLLAAFLAMGGYTVTQALNGEEALRALQDEGKFDLVLLDIRMPKRSGHEVCRRILEQFLPSELPVIMLTADEKGSTLIEGYNSGTSDYLTKPFKKDELLSRIKAHLHLLKINMAYEKFVPREFLHALGHESILDVKLGDQTHQEISIFFSDIRSFTKMSEGMSPKENFDFLNDYLQRVTPTIKNNNGFIDKYIGDAIMALFPKKVEDAIEAAIDTMKQIKIFNIERQEHGSPPINIGIGLHTGSFMLGKIGDKEWSDVTVISDAVNLASRLEGLTKRFGCSITISDYSLSKLQDRNKYNHRFLGKIQVKGKKDIVSVFEIYDGDPDHIIDLKIKTKIDFEEGLHHYFEREFAEAIICFKKVLYKNPDAKTALFYLKRSAQYVVEGVPDNWQGVEALNTK